MNNNRFNLLETFDSDNEDFDSSDNLSIDYHENSNNQHNSRNTSNFITTQNNKKIIKRPKTFKVDYFNKYNHKKIMCQNYILNNICTYGDKCLYAHNLDEQRIDIKRKKILNILSSTESLDNQDLHLNRELYKELCIFTKLCNECTNKKCTGGYNCKFGAPLEKYLICYEDLNYNNCTDINCKKIHLSKRGLKPQYSNISTHINKPLINNINMLIPFINNLNMLNIPTTMSTDNLYVENNDMDENCDESIFIDKFKITDE